MASFFRRRRDSDTWHFCTNCTNWPPTWSDHVDKYDKPTTGEFCDQCRAKRKEGNCQ